MSVGELRLISSLEIAALLMVPCGLWLCGKRPAPLPATPETEDAAAPPYRMGGADLAMGLMLYGLIALLMFSSKWWAVFYPRDTTAEDAPLTASMIWKQFVFVQGMQLAIIWAWLRVRGARMAQVFGMVRMGFLRTIRTAAVCIVPAGITATVSLVLMLRLLNGIGWPVEQQEAVSMVTGARDLWIQIALVVVACLGAPVVEEVLFRGVIFGSLREMTNRWFAAIVSALLFGLIHLHLPSLPALCLLGFFFAMAYEFTGSLTVSIVMHAMFNSIQVIIAILHGGK